MVLLADCAGSAVRWNPTYSNLLASAHGGHVRVWDTRMASATANIMAHTSTVYSVDWNPRQPDEFVTTAPNDREQMVKLWSMANPRKPRGHVCTAQASLARFTPFENGLVTTVLPRARPREGGETLLWSLDHIYEVPPPAPQPRAPFAADVAAGRGTGRSSPLRRSPGGRTLAGWRMQRPRGPRASGSSRSTRAAAQW